MTGLRAVATGAPRPDCAALFRAFLLLGLSGFGGVLPFARRMLVDRRQWLPAPEFSELLGLCQFLPGGNVVNLSVAVGWRFRGLPGAVAAVTGLLAAPAAILVLAGIAYDRLAADPLIRRMLAGVAAVAAGLLAGLAWRLAAPFRRAWRALLVIGLVFAAVAVLRLPLPLVLGLMLPASIALMRRPAPAA